MLLDDKVYRPHTSAILDLQVRLYYVFPIYWFNLFCFNLRFISIVINHNFEDKRKMKY